MSVVIRFAIVPMVPKEGDIWNVRGSTFEILIGDATGQFPIIVYPGIATFLLETLYGPFEKHTRIGLREYL